MNLVEKITKDQIRTDLPEFRVGDTIVVGYHIKEGNKERVQDFEGIVKAIKGSGISKNFIVRKISSGVGVEKTYTINNPRIAYIKVIRKGKVRRAKLNFLKNIKGSFKIKERN